MSTKKNKKNDDDDIIAADDDGNNGSDAPLEPSIEDQGVAIEERQRVLHMVMLGTYSGISTAD